MVAASVLLAVVLLQFIPIWARGLTPFWGDLTYIHHPWQAFSTQLFQAGRLPLWDPYLYLGMPLIARLQNGIFYPGETPFYLFGFATGLAVFHLVHYWLAGWLMFLWLRSLRLSAAAGLGGALIFCLGGGLASRMPFINHLSVLSLMPSLFLFFRRPLPLALCLACAFLAGYPAILVGAAAAAWAVMMLVAAAHPARQAAPAVRAWLLGGLFAAALCACQLLPGAELMSLSRRSGGMDLAETLLFGYSFGDLVQWVSPVLAPWPAFDPAVNWWKCSYVGFVGFSAALAGLCLLRRRRSMAAAVLLIGIALLLLGGNTAVSRALWAHFPPLSFVRYPGNLAYLAFPLLSLLAAVGFEKAGRARRGVLVVLAACELSLYGWGAAPLAPRRLFTSAGPLVRELQQRLEGTRYLLSPLALERHSGAGTFDWKHRLYGMTNGPFRLRAAGNFGEPLVPRSCYALMDSLYRQPSAEAVAGLLPWAGVSRLLTIDPVAPTPLLSAEGASLWAVSRVRASVALAYWFDEETGARLPAGLASRRDLPPLGAPLEQQRVREDRFTVEGRSLRPGWAYVAEPLYPGWSVTLETPQGLAEAKAEPALLAFQKVRVPAGPWRLRFSFDPFSWRLGSLLTCAALVALACYCYNRACRLYFPEVAA
jgi:hypothetical protein